MIPAFMLYLSPLLAATVGAIMSLQACAALICSPLQPSDAAPAEGRYRSDRKNAALGAALVFPCESSLAK